MVLAALQQRQRVQVVHLGLQEHLAQTVQVEHLRHQQVRQVRLKHRVQTAQMVQAVPPLLPQE